MGTRLYSTGRIIYIVTGDTVRISNVQGDVTTGIVKGSGHIVGNTVRITKEQLSVLPGDYAKVLEQFLTGINRQFKINNVSPETAKELRGNIQGLVREVRGVDEKRLTEDKRLKIKGRISTIIENILTVASSSTKVSTDIARGRIEEEKIKPQSTIEGLKENEQNVKEMEKMVREIEEDVGGKAEKIQIGEFKLSRDELDVKKKVLEGNRFYFGGSYTKALELYEQAAEIDAYYVDTWYNMGKCYEKMQRYDDAIKSYDHVIEIDPKNAGALYSKGSLLSRETSKQKFRVSIVVSIVFLVLITIFLDNSIRIQLAIKMGPSAMARSFDILYLIEPLRDNAGTVLTLIAAVVFSFFMWYKEGHMYYAKISRHKGDLVLVGVLIIGCLWFLSYFSLNNNLAKADEYRIVENKLNQPIDELTSSDLTNEEFRLSGEVLNGTFGFLGSVPLIIISSTATVSFVLFLYNVLNPGQLYLEKARELGKSL